MDWIVSVRFCAALVVVDQLIKAWATAVLAPVGTMPLLPGIIQLRYVLNDGAAFSMLAGKQGHLPVRRWLQWPPIWSFTAPKGWTVRPGC